MRISANRKRGRISKTAARGKDFKQQITSSRSKQFFQLGESRAREPFGIQYPIHRYR
jgi:hypothetical protein